MHYFKQWYILLILLVFCCLVNCGLFMCGDVVDWPPEILLDRNEFVFMAELISCDTLIELGSMSYLGNLADFHVVEFAFEANDIIKSNNIFNRYYLWVCQKTRQKDGFTNIPDFPDKDSFLIYGNSIKNDDDIVNIYVPNIAAGIDMLRTIAQNDQVDLDWMAKTEDSLLILKIKASNELKQIFKDRRRSGEVIYCTDDGLATIKSFLRDEIGYCDKSGWIPYFINGKEYVRRLKAEAKIAR